MEYFKIRGGKPLNGSIAIHGAKNSVLPILAASLLYSGESIIHNCPNLSDVHSAFKILRSLGCKVRYDGDTAIIDCSVLSSCDIPDKLMREMRSSIIFLGAITARCGKSAVSLPGGCELGPRPIDLHLSSFRQLGIDVNEEGGNIVCTAQNPRGCDINLSFQSVGATENIMLAATACKGTTKIINAAREPEICDLQDFLRKCGFKVSGAGSSIITIEGGLAVSAPEHTVIPDRIVAATCLSACAAAGGQISLTNVIPQHLSPMISVLSDCGAIIKTNSSTIAMDAGRRLRGGGTIRTMPYPGFPTDAQAPLMAAMTLASGTSLFIETIFDNRFRHVAELMRMGADIKTVGRIAVVTGVKNLYGADVIASDLRGGAALAVAAAAADGDSQIHGITHIQRGYCAFEKMFSALGIDISLVSDSDVK